MFSDEEWWSFQKCNTLFSSSREKTLSLTYSCFNLVCSKVFSERKKVVRYENLLGDTGVFKICTHSLFYFNLYII